MQRNTRLVQSTAGVVLDPFSIMTSGLIRRGINTKNRVQSDGFLDILHGEAKFKQAFINACHFAETMSVIGPVCQLDWGAYTDPIFGSLMWRAKMGEGDNVEFFENFKNIIDHNAGRIEDVTQATRTVDGLDRLVHVMPDCTLREDPTMVVNRKSSFTEQVMKHIYDDNWHGSYTRGLRQHPDIACHAKGGPVAALLAVVFTFKKPYGDLHSTELTNLGTWPPVVFFLPVLVPGGTDITAFGYGGDVRSVVTSTQPTMMSYQIRISGEEDTRRAALPFGQPFKLTSVSKWGKPSDTLRSLSDVFNSLWSQATQYSAWNTRMDWHQGEAGDRIPDKNVVEFALDPLGAGRRIRGHNRFSTKYDMYGLSMLWEPELPWSNDKPQPHPVGWNLDSAADTMNPVRFQSLKSDYHSFVFVLPSFFGSDTRDALKPIALTMMKYMVGYDASLADFLNGDVVTTVKPNDCRDENPETTIANASFADKAVNYLRGRASQVGALPLHTVPVNLAFQMEGTPNVFGMRVPYSSILDNTCVSIGDIDYEMMESFKFMEAFCSNSTRGLTGTFDKIKKKAVNATGSGLVDDSEVVDLFDITDDEEMM